MKKSIIAVFVALFLSSGAVFAQQVTVTIFHTGDTHGHGFDTKSLDYSKMASYVKDFRGKNNDNVLFLDAGDAFSGTPIVDLHLGKPNAQVMNLMTYDAMVIGEADFVYGGKAILELNKETKFPFLSANIYHKNKIAFNPYILREINGVKFAIIGASPMDLIPQTNNSRYADFSETDIIDEVKNIVEFIRDQVDVIIVLSHLGKSNPNFTVDKLIAAVPGIDIVIDGHDHASLPNGRKVKNTFIVNSGRYNEFLGVLSVKLNNKKIVSTTDKLLALRDLPKVNPDKEVAQAIADLKDEDSHYRSEVVAVIPFELNGKKASVQSAQTSLGLAVTDAIREYAKTDIAFTLASLLNASINAGQISRADIINALPSTSPIVTRKMTGKQIVTLIENNYTAKNLSTSNYIHISGISFSVDFSKPSGSRMTDILVNGKPINLDKTYTVATSERIDVYGINETAKIQKAFIDKSLAQIFEDYLKKHKKLEVPQDRVVIKK